MAYLAGFVAPGGRLLVICRGREPAEDAGAMPWPLTRAELDRFAGEGLEQVRLEFPSREAASAYAERHGLVCEVSEPHRRSVTPKPYAENFLAVPEPELWPDLLLAA